MRNVALIALISLLLIGGAMAVGHASTLNATINPKTNVANVTATSNFVAVLNYQNGSPLSQYLSGDQVSIKAFAVINSTYLSSLDKYVEDGQDSAPGNGSQDVSNSTDSNSQDNGSGNVSNDNSNSRDPSAANVSNTTQPQLHVVNATITYDYYLSANNTTLTVYRNLTLNMTITNIIQNVSGHQIITMNWRAFRVQGQLMADLNGMIHLKLKNEVLNETYQGSADVNELGDQFGVGEDMMGSNPFSGDMMEHLFGHFSNINTIDFTEFKVPLSQWHRVYNPTTNETLFTYNISKDIWVNETINSSMLGNISLSYHYDPSSTIAIMGDAVPSTSNSLEIVSASASSQSGLPSSSMLYLGVGVLAVVVIVGALVLVSRKKK